MAREIKIEEVKKHKSKKSNWIIIHNDVYDVTSFLSEHPGGEDSLMEVAGQDGTQAFEDVGHSDDARELLKKYKIGSLPVTQQSNFIDKCCPRIPKIESTDKSWRTFDGSHSHLPKTGLKSGFQTPPTPRVERRVDSIIVPRESSNLKWYLLALAGAIVIGFAIKKYAAK